MIDILKKFNNLPNFWSRNICVNHKIFPIWLEHKNLRHHIMQFETIPFCLRNCLGCCSSSAKMQSYYPTRKLQLLNPQNSQEFVKITQCGKGNDSGPQTGYQGGIWKINGATIFLWIGIFYRKSCLGTGGQSCRGEIPISNTSQRFVEGQT